MNPRLFTRISTILVLMMSSVSLVSPVQANAEGTSKSVFRMRTQSASTSHVNKILPSARSGLISFVFRADFLSYSDSPYMLFPKGTSCKSIWDNTIAALRFDWLDSHVNDINSTVVFMENCRDTADGVKVWIEATMDALTERGNTLLQEYAQMTQGNTLYSYPVIFAKPQQVSHEINIETNAFSYGLDASCSVKTIVAQMDAGQAVVVCDDYLRLIQSRPSQEVFRDFALRYFAPDAIDPFLSGCMPEAKNLSFEIFPIYRDDTGHELRRWYYIFGDVTYCPAEGCLSQ